MSIFKNLSRVFVILILFHFDDAMASQPPTDWQLRPSVSVGYNKSQGSYWSLGLNLEKWFDENILVGVGAFYSVGSPAESTMSIGAGPFAAYFLPITDFLTGELREEIDFVSQRTPLVMDDTKYKTDSGFVSATSLGVHLRLGDHFGLSGGYRLVVALSNSALDNDRSGTFLGIGISL